MLARTALGRIAAVAPTANAGSRLGLASMSMGVRSKHTLPDLPYDFGALEPSISGQIMELHHQKHHQTYVNGLNQAEETLANAVAKNDVKAAIATQKALNFNGGGHVNHSLFWQNLAPSKQGGGELSAGPLKEAIERDFGSLDGLKSKFNAQLAGIQGSGWGWLGLNPSTGKLDIITTANQDPLLSHVPLIGVDAW
ncbi:manganese superoxide dismutase [Ceraceosorus bombacis]|nr:manganese superoxide dismutase [Ceraceosorus bombacis]